MTVKVDLLPLLPHERKKENARRRRAVLGGIFFLSSHIYISFLLAQFLYFFTIGLDFKSYFLPDDRYMNIVTSSTWSVVIFCVLLFIRLINAFTFEKKFLLISPVLLIDTLSLYYFLSFKEFFSSVILIIMLFVFIILYFLAQFFFLFDEFCVSSRLNVPLSIAMLATCLIIKYLILPVFSSGWKGSFILIIGIIFTLIMIVGCIIQLPITQTPDKNTETNTSSKPAEHFRQLIKKPYEN